MGLYPEKSLAVSDEYQTVSELIKGLEKIKTAEVNNIDVCVKNASGDFIVLRDAAVTLKLIEKTLSDGSKMHDIKMTFTEILPY